MSKDNWLCAIRSQSSSRSSGKIPLMSNTSAAPVVTQNGPDLNLVDESGRPSRAWPDTFAPTSRIWADNWNTGAVYSPDGMLISFDNGTIWQRDMGPPVLQVPPRVRARRAELVR